MIVTETMVMANNYLYYAFNKVNLFRLISFSRAGNCKCTGQFFMNNCMIQRTFDGYLTVNTTLNG